MCAHVYACTCVCVTYRFTFNLAFAGVAMYMSVYTMHTDLHAQCMHSGTNTYTHSALRLLMVPDLSWVLTTL